MEYETLKLELQANYAEIQLTRPDKLNAISSQLIRDITEALKEIGDSVNALIITGSGKAFCAGADIGEIQRLNGPLAALGFVDTVNECFHRLEVLPYPVIAAVNGLALGGGCELSLCCDLRIAAESALFGLPEVKIGVLPGAGGTQRLQRQIGATKAKEMLFLGGNVDAIEAYRVGLVNKVVPDAELLDEARKWAEQLTKLPRQGLRFIKSAVYEGAEKDIRAAIEIEKKAFAMLFATADQKEGINAFMEKRKPQFIGG